MALDFVAIDFETANSFPGSACAVGLVRVTNGEVVDRQMRLIKPVPRDWNPKKQPLRSLFDRYNVMIHGISPEDVIDAPPWHEVWPGLLDYAGGLPWLPTTPPSTWVSSGMRWSLMATTGRPLSTCVRSFSHG